MSQITKIEMWKDVGFQEGAVEVPSMADTLPELEANTDNYIRIVYDNGIKTSTADFFSGFSIPEVFADYMSYSYLRVTYAYNNHDDPMVFYGWVDDIALRSDTVNSPSVYVSWHIDYWRTYLSSVKLGYGLIQNRPIGAEDPPQPLAYRYRRLATTHTDLIPETVIGSGEYWGILNCTLESNQSTKVETFTCITPLSNNRAVFFKLSADATDVYQAPSINDWITGAYDEMFGIAPTSINSAFVTPLPPIKLKAGDGSQTNPYILSEVSPSTDVHEDTKPGNWDTSREVVGNAGNVGFILANGETTKDLSGIYVFTQFDTGFKYRFEAWFYDQKLGETTNDGDSITAMPLDELVKQTFGEDVFNSLQPGDEVSFGSNVRVFGGYTLGVGSIKDGYYTVKINFFAEEHPTYKLNDHHTFAGSIFLNGLPTSINVTLRTHTQGDSTGNYVVKRGERAGSVYGIFYRKDARMDEYEMDLPAEVATSDKEELVILDMEGIPIGTLPWGIRVQKYHVRNIISSTFAYIQIRFNALASASEGLEFTVPLISLDIASNSYSEYVYSGQREFDITQKRLAADQALISGLTSVATGAVDTAIMGGLSDVKPASDEVHTYTYQSSPSAPVETATETITGGGTKGFGAKKAGIASITTGLAGTLIEYGVTREFNDRLQAAEDTLHAKQIDSVIVPGSGWDFLYHGQTIRISSLKPDEYSRKRFEADKELNGVMCSEPTGNCDYVRSAEGPFRIGELVVTGTAPVHARSYIKGRFANGVRIKTINTQNVTEGD